TTTWLLTISVTTLCRNHRMRKQERTVLLRMTSPTYHSEVRRLIAREEQSKRTIITTQVRLKEHSDQDSRVLYAIGAAQEYVEWSYGL
ncbi:hypothetical protein J6590_077739, partial [Homalodisca vitripennis]